MVVNRDIEEEGLKWQEIKAYKINITLMKAVNQISSYKTNEPLLLIN